MCKLRNVNKKSYTEVGKCVRRGERESVREREGGTLEREREQERQREREKARERQSKRERERKG